MASQQGKSKIVMLRKVKRTKDYFSRWPAYEICSDDYGTWLYSPSGTVHLGYPGTGDVVLWEVCRSHQAPDGLPQIHLMPKNAWWVAFFFIGKNGDKTIAVDISVPATLKNDEWTYIDLELDPIWRSDRPTELFDVDEFDDAVKSGLINDEEARNANSAATEVMNHLQNGMEPFGKVGWEIMEKAIASQLPAIKYNNLENWSDHKIIITI